MQVISHCYSALEKSHKWTRPSHKQDVPVDAKRFIASTVVTIDILN